MAITYEQALSCDEFHRNGSCKRSIGPRGGVKVTCEIWRRNGKTKTWKTRPEAFQIPVKYGIRTYDCLTHRNDFLVHCAEDCPLNKEGEVK